MKNPLLVATDLSGNSKGAVRFAIQYARQTKKPLIFFHALPYLKPTRWSDARYDAYAKTEVEKAAKELQRFVLGIFRSAGLHSPKFECVVKQSPDVTKAIIAEAEASGATAICMSPRGGGRMRKLLGTHSSAIIQASPVPVFLIPATYRRGPVKSMVYASDLNEIGSELKRVRDLAKPLKANVSVVHYDYLADVEAAMAKLEKVAKRYKYPDVKFRFQKFNVDKSLASHLARDMKKAASSMVVLFTNQKRGWFDRLFMSSKSIDVAHASKIPLLIMPK